MRKSASLNKIIQGNYSGLTSKGKHLADFVLSKPDKAVFMTTRQLAAAVDISEATVVRFVRQLGYETYSLFINALKELIDTELTLIERSRLAQHATHSDDSDLNRIIHDDIENIQALSKNIDLSEARKIRRLLKDSDAVHIIGSRLSYTAAYYMSWIMAKVRTNVFLHNGSDKTTIDRLIFATPRSVVVVIATSRYPNELIRMGKLAKRHHLKLVVLTDSLSCPLVQFSDHALVSSLKNIPYLGSPVSLMCLVNYLVHTLAGDMGKGLKLHQEKLEQAYLENDILFNY